jgi:hypothetical protein
MAEAPKQALVWVSGGRDYRNAERVRYILDNYLERHGIRVIITGACRVGQTPVSNLDGADGLAEEWARMREVPYIGVPARWQSEGSAAGPIRNERIVSDWHPDVLLAFPGGAGTENSIEVAELHGIVVFRISDPGYRSELQEGKQPWKNV